MPPEKDAAAYLWDMLDAARAVVGFVEGRSSSARGRTGDRSHAAIVISRASSTFSKSSRIMTDSWTNGSIVWAP